MSRFITGQGNSVKKFTHGGRSTSFPRRYGYIDDNLGNGYEDDVPAMLTAGEYVIKRSSVQKYGETFLNRLNQGLVNDDVRYMNRGGRVNNNGRNDMPHMSRTRQQTRRRRASNRRNTVSSPAYTSRRRRTSSRRTASPRRQNSPAVGMMRNNSVRRPSTRRPARRAVNGTVQNYNYGGSVGNTSTMMTTRTNTVNQMNGVRETGMNNGLNTMNNLLKYNGKYYDCHGSLYFTPACSEVTNIMLRDNKTGKVDTPKF